MNFFQEQEIIRKRISSFQRLFYGTVFATAMLTAMALFYLPGITSPYSENPFGTDIFFLSGAFWIIFGAVVLFIIGMSQFKLLQLRQGGDYIAKLSGASAIPETQKNPKTQRLVNVVEEMSIAAGIVPPKIFIMQGEPHVNAFAAGFSTHDAAIAVSAGCLNNLSRDELQGVVAHEIGHIVNGDMRLNLQLIGYLFGLTGVADIGRFIMRTSSRNRRDRNSLAPLGLALFLIGIGGYFLGLLLKLRISRGQEFGADARAVQYTRNPEGIAGALRRIFAVRKTFHIEAPRSHELEHMYLHYPAKGLDVFSTHPPLEERIRKILPRWTPEDLLPDVIEEVLPSSVPRVPPREAATDFFRKISSKETVISDPTFSLKEMDLILGRLRNLEEAGARALLKELKDIIQEDNYLLSREILCYTLFRETLLPRKSIPSNRLGFQKVRNEVHVIFSFLAVVSTDSKEAQGEAYAKGMNAIYPGEAFTFKAQCSLAEITEAFDRARDLVPLAREKFIHGAQLIIEHDQVRNFNEEIFLKVLKQVLGVPA